jgi:hypothetical protein
MNVFKKLLGKRKLYERGMYSVEYGTRSGCFLVYIKEENKLTAHAFLVMPYPLETLFLSEEDIKNHLKNGGLKIVEILPQNVYEVCKANFVYIEKNKGI